MSATGPLVVVGDALLDVDLVGTASRLTPDAPVPVVEDVETRERPGGAALAAVIAARATLREVVLVSPMADDADADRLRALLADDARRAAYGAAGVQRARNRYRWARVVADTETVYRQVLASRRPVEVAR